jgi:peptidoglycan/xylan/chitin deacetylase (PgdA/CDA1 family)
VNKSVAKRTFYQLLAGLGIYLVGRLYHRRQALILTYHGVVRNGHNSYTNRNCVELAMFDRQMVYLARHYNVIPLSELVERLTAAEQLPPYTAAITFDDGFRNNLTVALPILKKYNLPATIFLATSYVSSEELGLWTEHVDSLIHRTRANTVRLKLYGMEKVLPLRSSADREDTSDQIRAFLKTLAPTQRESVLREIDGQLDEGTDLLPTEDGSGPQTVEVTAAKEERYAFLTWEQVQMMTNHSITFGSHTHTHAILSPLSESDVKFEMTESRRLIEEILGVTCSLFSYPNGAETDFGRREERLLRSLGYIAAVSQVDGFNDTGTNMMALRRINIPRDDSFSFFLAKISGVWSMLQHLQSGIHGSFGLRRRSHHRTARENRTE